MTQPITVMAPKRRFSVAEYHRLAQTGILKEDDRIELIKGEIIEMSPICPKHAGNLARMVRILTLLFHETAIVNPQNPIQLDDHSEPEPDISVLKPRDDFYTTAHPKPEEILFLVELSESSLQYDREIKLPLYACFNIPEVWLVDLRNHRVIVHTHPSGEEYLQIKTFLHGEEIVSELLPEKLTVDQLLTPDPR